MDNPKKPPEEAINYSGQQFEIKAPNGWISLERSGKGYYWQHTPEGTMITLEKTPGYEELLNTLYPSAKYALNHAIDLGFTPFDPMKEMNKKPKDYWDKYKS